MIAILGLVIGWILTVFIGVLALMILIKIWKDEIDLKFLISDEKGDASLSRFQFLVFTFVIAMSLFYLVVINPNPGYPPVPPEILALLGISGGSYVLAKGMQTSHDVNMAELEQPKITTSTTVIAESNGSKETKETEATIGT